MLRSISDSVSLSHIGWAVASLEEAMDSMAILGFKAATQVCHDNERHVHLVILRDTHNNTIELVAPGTDASPVSDILKRNGAVPYHTCFSVNGERWEDVKNELCKRGFILLHKPAPAPLFNGKNVAFFYSKHIGLIEFIINSD